MPKFASRCVNPPRVVLLRGHYLKRAGRRSGCGKERKAPRPHSPWSDSVGLFRGLRLDECLELHARFVYARHRWIRFEVALVGNCVEHLRHQAAIGHGNLIAIAILSVLSLPREKRFHHLEALGAPMPVPGVYALL